MQGGYLDHCILPSQSIALNKAVVLEVHLGFWGVQIRRKKEEDILLIFSSISIRLKIVGRGCSSGSICFDVPLAFI